MDKKIEREQKKRVRKMAASMLWADFKNLVLGWKVIALVFMLFVFFFLPYFKKVENFNGAAIYYFVMWTIFALAAFAETAFNYLPVSTKDMVYYLKCRTNLLTVCMVAVSLFLGILLQATGAEVFWERGLQALIFLLITVEGALFVSLYDYSKPMGVKFWDDFLSEGRKIRMAIYCVYNGVLLFASMMNMLRMSPEKNYWKTLLIYFCLYLGMYIIRADIARWVQFNEFCRSPHRTMFATPEQQNQQ